MSTLDERVKKAHAYYLKQNGLTDLREAVMQPNFGAVTAAFANGLLDTENSFSLIWKPKTQIPESKKNDSIVLLYSDGYMDFRRCDRNEINWCFVEQDMGFNAWCYRSDLSKLLPMELRK